MYFPVFVAVMLLRKLLLCEYIVAAPYDISIPLQNHRHVKTHAPAPVALFATALLALAL